MSYEEFRAWAGEDVRAEWVEGEVIEFMPPKYLHQAMVLFLGELLGAFIRLAKLGKLIVAPFELKIRPQGASREPDLMFLAHEHLDRLTPEMVAGPPDLIIEIVSDDSVHRDRVDKFDEYEAGGVREYGVVDYRLNRRRAEFYQLDHHGRYQQALVGDDGVYRSAVLPGFWLKVDWLAADELDWLAALSEMLGPDRLAEALRAGIQRPG
jgi:Uma2 family endonuclease